MSESNRSSPRKNTGQTPDYYSRDTMSGKRGWGSRDLQKCRGGAEQKTQRSGYNKTSAKKKTLIILQADDKDYKTIVTVLKRSHLRRYKKKRPMKVVEGRGGDKDVTEGRK